MIARWHNYVGCVVLLFVALLASAQPPILVGNTFQQEVVSKQADLLEDPSGTLTINNILQKPRPFKRHTGPSINPGFTNSFFWVHFRITNPDSVQKELLLEVENPHINKLQLFTRSQGRLQASILTGDNLPFTQRPVWHPHFLFPVTIASGQTIDCYLWVDKHGEQVQIPLRLWDRAYFSENAYKLYLSVGFLLGIGGLYCVLSLLTLLFFRLRLTLYYFFYTVSIWLFLTAHTGLGFAFIWPNETWWASAARPTTALMIHASSLLFVRVFFRLSTTYRGLYRYTTILLICLGLVFLALWSQNPALGLFQHYWYNPVYYEGKWLLRFMIAIHTVASVVILSVVATGIFIYTKHRQPEALWLSIGYLLTLLSGFSITLVHVGLLPDNYATHNLPLISNALDTIILSILLANRFKNIHVQNAQISAELADQRQRNAIQLLEGQRIERKRLSQELHDGISLSLANIRLKLSVLAEKLNGQRTEAQHLVEALSEVGQDVRQFSHALSPVMLERYGLVDALDELVQTINSSHPSLLVTFRHDEISNESVQALVAQTLYLISLELLNNITKHAGAHEASLHLTQTATKLTLTVSDDGTGYDIQQEKPGIGLQNIQARVALLNGHFTVERLPVGMKHSIDLPIQARLFS